MPEPPIARKRSWVALLVLLLVSTVARAGDLAVTAPEAIVRTAPFDVAPALAWLHPGDKLTGNADAQPGWLEVTLPDGRRGFVRAAEVQGEVGPPPPGPPPATPGSAPTPASAQASTVPPTQDGPVLLGFAIDLVPDGSLHLEGGGAEANADLVATSALGLFLDVPVARGIQVGLSPRVMLKVRGTDATESGFLIDLRARLTGCRPLSPRASVCARFSPGYAILSLPSGDLPSSASSPSGLTLDASVGSQVALLPDLVLVFDAGYQWSFLDTSLAGVRVDYRVDFLHLGVGFALGL